MMTMMFFRCSRHPDNAIQGEGGERGKQKKRSKNKREKGRNQERGEDKVETSLKMIISEGKLSQNRVREGFWEAWRKFG